MSKGQESKFLAIFDKLYSSSGPPVMWMFCNLRVKFICGESFSVLGKKNCISNYISRRIHGISVNSGFLGLVLSSLNRFWC